MGSSVSTPSWDLQILAYHVLMIMQSIFVEVQLIVHNQ
jgi:hypothetical protein